jgi:hypothetical protein
MIATRRSSTACQWLVSAFSKHWFLSSKVVLLFSLSDSSIHFYGPLNGALMSHGHSVCGTNFSNHYNQILLEQHRVNWRVCSKSNIQYHSLLSTLTMGGLPLPHFFGLCFVFATVNLRLNASLGYSYIGSGLAGPCFATETCNESVSFGGHDPGLDIVILSTLASECSSLGTLPPSSDEDDDA